MPWLLRFAWQSLPRNAGRNAAAIAALLADSLSGWREQATEIGAGDLLKQNGCLYLYGSKRAFAAASADIALRRRHGIAQEFLSADDVAALEPNLPPFEGGGLLFPHAVNLTDPGTMMKRLTQAARTVGVRFIQARAERIRRSGGTVWIAAEGFDIAAKTVVIAAGAHSKALAAQAGDHPSLDTERGYHVEFDMEAPPVSRPVCPTARGFYLVPMAGRLRVAGTVELGGLSAPANPHRIALLERGAREMFPPPRQTRPDMAGFSSLHAELGAGDPSVTWWQRHHSGVWPRAPGSDARAGDSAHRLWTALKRSTPAALSNSDAKMPLRFAKATSVARGF